MILDKSCYLPIEQIKGSIEISGYPDVETIEISIQMCRIYDWYDVLINKKVSATIYDNVLSFVLPNGFENGLYAIIAVSIDNHVVYGNINDNENCGTAFFITEKNIDALSLYKKILKERELCISKAKFRTEDKEASSYDVLLFIKNLDISNNAYYDTIQVYPYDSLKTTSEVEYINDFIKNNTNINVAVNPKSFERSIPSAVFVISNIMAYNYEEAEKYAINEAEKLNSIFTVLLHSHGTIFATLTNGKKERKYKTTILDIRYKGNLLHLAEDGFNVRHYFRYISKSDSYITVYLKLLRDAQNENERMLKYYRYWNILEGIAMRKGYCNNPLVDWQGNIIRNNKGICKIGEQALNNVFELVRQNFSNIDSAVFVQELPNISKPKEFLSVCYQRRNCCAHWGSCNNKDASICCVNKKQMKKCKESNIVDSSKPEGFSDAILRKLQDITFQIVLEELQVKAGKSLKSTSLIENLISETSKS